MIDLKMILTICRLILNF